MTEKDYQICTKLVLDTTDPDIIFDEDGVCQQFHDFHSTIVPLWHAGPDASARLSESVAAIKAAGKDQEYDCLIGLSGGADSSYMLHVMVTEYGLRPLVFHVDAGWNSELAVHNINCMIDKLGLDLFTEVVNWQEVRDFQLSLFKSGLPNLDYPQDIAFIGVLYKYAAQHNIKYILNGGNISTECVSYPLRYFYYADMRLIGDVRRRFGTRPLESYPFTSMTYRKLYMPLVKGVKMVKPLNMMPYVKHDAMRELERVYGWKPYAQKHFESVFTRFFEGYWLPTRFGYDPRRVQFSSMILTGQMTRDKALKKLQEPAYEPELLDRDFSYIATKLGISKDELQGYHDMDRKFYWDYKNGYAFTRFAEKTMSLFAKTKYGGAY